MPTLRVFLCLYDACKRSAVRQPSRRHNVKLVAPVVAPEDMSDFSSSFAGPSPDHKRVHSGQEQRSDVGIAAPSTGIRMSQAGGTSGAPLASAASPSVAESSAAASDVGTLSPLTSASKGRKGRKPLALGLSINKDLWQLNCTKLLPYIYVGGSEIVGTPKRQLAVCA